MYYCWYQGHFSSKCHHIFKCLLFYFTDHNVDLSNGKEDTQTEQSATNLHYTPEEVVKPKLRTRTRSATADMENALSRYPLPEPDAGQDSDVKGRFSSLTETVELIPILTIYDTAGVMSQSTGLVQLH